MSEREGRGPFRPRFRWTFLAVLVVALVGGVAGADESADPGRAAEEGWAPVTVLYMTDVKGKIEPCG